MIVTGLNLFGLFHHDSSTAVALSTRSNCFCLTQHEGQSTCSPRQPIHLGLKTYFTAARKSVLLRIYQISENARGRKTKNCTPFRCMPGARAPGRGLHTHYSIEIAETAPMADPASRLGSLKGFIRCKALGKPGSRLHSVKMYAR